ncbi:MAG TPA: GMC family oxidoreductase [Stellaceae bacterium]|jgi:choline dehydrogenase-like flavoprotein
MDAIAPSASEIQGADRAAISAAVEIGKHYDVIVIGSGAGGSSISLSLARRGRSVLVVERGNFLRPQPRSDSDPVGRYLYDVVKDPADAISFVGGQTKFYGAALYRLRRSNFHAIDHGCGVSPAWPISYTELEPYYDQAEKLYRVHGALEGDPTEPPRASPYPYPPIPHHPVIAEVIERLRQSGTPVSPIPKALDYRPGGKCVLCPTCDAYFCQVDGKMDAEVAALRPALATGNVHLITDTECLRVLTDPRGTRAIGATLRRNGAIEIVHADTVVVAAGIPGSAALLRRSRTERHPDGLGNAGGALGRYLSGHSVGHIFPLIGWRVMPAIHSKTFAINTFHDGAPDWPYPLGIIQTAGQMPFWQTAHGPIRPIAEFIGRRSLTCFYATEALPTRQSGLVFENDKVVGKVHPIHNLAAFEKLRKIAADAFRHAGYRVITRRRQPYLWHDVGTARLGADPSQSVVDPNCRVHGIEGLYVVDQSVLPSAGAVNTALTIIALALRAGDHIAKSTVAPSCQSELHAFRPNEPLTVST